MHTISILVVIGSTRQMRRSPAIAAWVAALGDHLGEAAFQLVDLRDLGLSDDDEPGIPAAQGGYSSPATQRWSERVRAAQGVVIVSPQYNWGYPAPLKNAIDHLYPEWRGKPVLIITYGSQGGGKCAAQLREVLGGMKVALTAASPALRLARQRIEDNDGAVEPEVDFDAHRGEVEAALRELVALAHA
ncbi:MAG TPA: NADPH-dependent FMN reductase [Caulobacteraceae bacterium]|jgi:NAD(P)H-dependent FMN reductase|nr:NADPH-dependent FMN reductase [Caulobacteraceae bacterium]